MAGALLAVGWAVPAHAHGFGQRYDLPVPLWLYLTGAGAAVALSFVAMGLFFRGRPALHSYPRFNLLRWRVGRLLAHSCTLFVCRLLSVGAFLLIILAGHLGKQNPVQNLVPTMVWIIWWVGLAYVSALVGDLWALINPWKVIFAWAEALFRRFNPEGELSHRLPYPRWLGVWPAVILFLAFAWAELVWGHNDVPLNLAFAAVIYSLITWTGMLIFGREEWLRGGEAFSVAFGLLARFAPTEVRVVNPELCEACSSAACRELNGECVNCYECFARAEEADREWNLRPPAVGLLDNEAVHPSMVVFVLLVLSTVTFDGFMETVEWQRIVVAVFYPARSFLQHLPWVDQYLLSLIFTLGLVAFPTLFLCVYMVFCALMAGAVGRRLSTAELARLFVFSLVPIAIAYHLAHYLSFLLVQGQRIIPLASDPFGFGWNLLGTAGHRIDIGIVGARFLWYTSVVAIVAGHIIAVYLAHVMALRALGERRAALQSQYPMLALMVGYTMVSLWILAQPIVESEPGG